MTTNIRGIEITTNTQPDFWCESNISAWEQHTFDIIDRFVAPKSTFIDIGAWNGVLSMYAAKKGAKTVSIEPDAIAHGYLIDNFELNNVSGKVINAAISNTTGKAILYHHGGYGSSMSSLVHGFGGQEVDTIAISDLIGNEENISLIKIDIEGAEVEILPHAIDLLCKYPIHLSLHPFWSDTQKLKKFIFSFNVYLYGVELIDVERFEQLVKQNEGFDLLLLPK
jgi:FkbM family methyltransferase